MSIKFHIPDMTCSHCVHAITQAIQDQFQGAQVEADLSTHTVTVTGVGEVAAVEAVIKQEGYSPVEA